MAIGGDIFNPRPVTAAGSSNPSSGHDGELFFNTTDTTLYVWYGDAWNSVGTSDISGGLDNLLLTNGDHFLLTSDGGQDVLLLTSA